MTYTDEQLKQVLAKLLPEKVYCNCNTLRWNVHPITSEMCTSVLNTELLSLCWQIEQNIIKEQELAGDDVQNANHGNWTIYICKYLSDICGGNYGSRQHATWQQRAIALAKTKGIEIV